MLEAGQLPEQLQATYDPERRSSWYWHMGGMNGALVHWQRERKRYQWYLSEMRVENLASSKLEDTLSKSVRCLGGSPGSTVDSTTPSLPFPDFETSSDHLDIRSLEKPSLVDSIMEQGLLIYIQR